MLKRALNFSVGGVVMIDGVKNKFDGVVAGTEDDEFVFVDFRTGRRTPFTQREFDAAYTEGRFRFLRDYEDPDDVAPEPERADFGKALWRRRWCEAYDANA